MPMVIADSRSEWIHPFRRICASRSIMPLPQIPTGFAFAMVVKVRSLPLIRVFMAWQASDAPVELPEQNLTAPQRTGFTVVEWGGTEIE